MQQRATPKVLIEAAIRALDYWALLKWQAVTKDKKSEPIEFSCGYTGKSSLCQMIDEARARSGSKSMRLAGLNCHITTAKQTRSHQKGSLPMGGRAYTRTKGDISRAIDVLFAERFSERQQKLILGLFVPVNLRQGQIAKAFNFKASYASQIKQRAILLVIQELFSPVQEQERESA